jgi:hypothetical protein
MPLNCFGSVVAAVRAVHLGKRRWRTLVLGLKSLLEVVGPVPLVARSALGQRVSEGRDVARGLPHLASQDHRRVDTDDIVTLADNRLPPLPFDVLFELNAQGSVVPGSALATVDL